MWNRDEETDPLESQGEIQDSIYKNNQSLVSGMKKMLDKGLLDLRPDPRLSGLKMKISEYADIPTEYITCLPGIDHALEQVTLTYLEPGTEILLYCIA